MTRNLIWITGGFGLGFMTLGIWIRNGMRGAKQRWGSSRIKRRLWNHEFAIGRWESLENSEGDLVYHYIEKYCRGGSILDLGCGSGNTGCELDAQTYSKYTGVDISDVAIEKAKNRSKSCQREHRNHYIQSDISDFSPDSLYDVILFRESIYYIPIHQIKGVLARYSKQLKENGVFIIRWYSAEIPENFMNRIKGSYQIHDQSPPSPSGPTILVFRP